MPHEGRQGLTVNFRSQPAILDFANALLGQALEQYEPLVAHQPQVNPGPCVEFLWAPKPEKASVGEGRAVEAEWIARRIAAMIGREPLVAEGSSVAAAREGGRRRAAVPGHEQRPPLRGRPAPVRPELLPRRRSGVLRSARDLRPPESAARPGEPAGRGQSGGGAAFAVRLPQRRGAVRPVPAPPGIVGRPVRLAHRDALARRPGRGRSPRQAVLAERRATSRTACRSQACWGPCSPTRATTRRCRWSTWATASLPTCGSSRTWRAPSTAPACSAWPSSSRGSATWWRPSRARSRRQRSRRTPTWCG